MKTKSNSLKRKWTKEEYLHLKYFNGVRSDLAQELGIGVNAINRAMEKTWEELEGAKRVLSEREQANVIKMAEEGGLRAILTAYDGCTVVGAASFAKDHGILEGDLLKEIEARLDKNGNKNDYNNLLRALNRKPKSKKVKKPVYHWIYTKAWG